MTTCANTALKRVPPERIGSLPRRPPVDAQTLAEATRIVEHVRRGGASAVREYAQRFGERAPGEPMVLDAAEMRAALEALDTEQRGVLERAAERIGTFAQAQRAACATVDVPIPGGRAGHSIEPVASAGCYAPAGRFPLVSSVLMTAVTARTAGCERVVVASPSTQPLMLAAAAIADADQYLAVGGADAVAAMAFGFEGLEPCDVIAGPGNKWVTAAKQVVAGVVGIDMLAGPSELLIIADGSADPSLVAVDLLAQAEHDADAVPMLVTTSPDLADSVDTEIARRLEETTSDTARAALRNGWVCVTSSLNDAQRIADRIAAEHVEVMTREPEVVASALKNAGAVFIGARSAEVLGDYGAGPNHTLPTGGTARFQSGLSVQHFLRLRTWLRIDDGVAARRIIRDASSLASMEGLAFHAASARCRLED